MVDQVHAELYQDPDALPDHADWRTAVEAVAEQNWQLLARHRWLLGVDSTRPPLGPGTIAKYDIELRPLVGIGLDDVEVDQVLALVLEHVRSTARLSLGVAETSQASGRTDGEWWSTAGPVLAALIDPTKFPYAARIGGAAGREFDAAVDPERAYAFGLRTILDGVESLVLRKAARK